LSGGPCGRFFGIEHLEKDVAPEMMVYGTVQTGYQQGTFNALPNTPTFSNEVQPEKLVSYTAGIKTRWLDDRLQITTSCITTIITISSSRPTTFPRPTT
jgi:outer membrane receptor protein involved in Fe transport